MTNPTPEAAIERVRNLIQYVESFMKMNRSLTTAPVTTTVPVADLNVLLAAYDEAKGLLDEKDLFLAENDAAFKDLDLQIEVLKSDRDHILKVLCDMNTYAGHDEDCETFDVESIHGKPCSCGYSKTVHAYQAILERFYPTPALERQDGLAPGGPVPSIPSKGGET